MCDAWFENHAYDGEGTSSRTNVLILPYCLLMCLLVPIRVRYGYPVHDTGCCPYLLPVPIYETDSALTLDIMNSSH